MNTRQTFRDLAGFFLWAGLICLSVVPARAQEAMESVEMADVMRSNGKIFIVVAVVVVIFAGILAYLIQTERKLDKLEKRLKELEKAS